MSYNLLADSLAQAHPDLYPDTSPRHLDWFGHRAPLVLQEIQHWAPDVLLCQEVDHFPEMRDALRALGYDGVFTQRTGERTDGCATFWRTAVCSGIQVEEVKLSQYGLKDNVAQIVHVIPCAPGPAVPGRGRRGAGGLLLANTHLLFNCKRGDIKLGQMRTILDRMSRVLDALPCKGRRVGCVLAGDLNTGAGSALYDFLANGELHLLQHDRRNMSGQIEGWGYAAYQSSLRFTGQELRGYTPPLAEPPAPDSDAPQGSLPAPQQPSQHPPGQQAWPGGSCSPHTPRPNGGSRPSSSSSMGSSLRPWQSEPPPRGAPYPAWTRPPSGALWTDEEVALALGVSSSDLPGAAESQAGRRGSSRHGHYSQSSSALQQLRMRQAASGCLTARHRLQLESAYVHVLGSEPAFTTCHKMCMGTVDYIWFTAVGLAAADADPGDADDIGRFEVLRCLRVLQPPDSKRLPHGMPNSHWPSDHVPLVADFQLAACYPEDLLQLLTARSVTDNDTRP